MKLYSKILIGMILGIICGWVIHAGGYSHWTVYSDYAGQLFIRLIKLVVIPLILGSLILGAAHMGDIKKVGQIGIKALIFFMLTTFAAVTIGVSLANISEPGRYITVEDREALVGKYRGDAEKKIKPKNNENRLQGNANQEKSEIKQVLDLLVRIIPVNPFRAIASGDMLAIIFFSIFLGICLTMIGKNKAQPLLNVLEGFNESILKMVGLAMETAPYGVFALMLGVVGTMGIGILSILALYAIVVIIGLFLHLIIIHIPLMIFYLRMNPLHFLSAIKEALLLAFSTSSSSATLPVSLNVAQKNLGVSREVSSFILPLGATINMDGTALYQGVAAIFIAQVFGIELTFIQQIVMILTATLASIGAAGVPGAGMITLAIVLETAGIPAAGIALIFGLDRLLDMFRTSLNVIGDINCSAIIAKSEGESLT